MFDVFAVAQTDDIDDSDDDGLAGRGDTHQRAGVGGMEGLVCDDDVIFGHLPKNLYFKAGEGFPEELYDIEYAIGAFGKTCRGGVIDDCGVDDVVEGGYITVLYKRCIESTDDGFVLFLESGGGPCR